MATRRTSRFEAIDLSATDIVLVDTMIVIEAVDAGCWNAISGGREIVTVAECGEELRLKRQYTERQLGTWRTSLILELGL